jgi:alanyl-tRNA synthetase
MEESKMSSKKTIDQRIEAKQEEVRQLENQIKQLTQQQRTQERKNRNHRLCKRGGLVEKLLPDLTQLSDEQFETFVDKVLLTNHTTRILAGLVSSQPKNDVQADATTLSTGNIKPDAA